MLSSNQLTIEPQPTLIFGQRAIDRLSDTIRILEHSRAFIVTDAGLRATRIPDRITKQLVNEGIETEIFDDIVANPGIATLNAGTEAIRSFGPCAIIALGGGSSMDVAKGLGMAANNPGFGRDFDYRNVQKNPGSPLIAIPTTAGTGAETNAFGVIDDPDKGEKFYVGHASMMPRYVICDPLLTVGLPPRPTAATGMDALAHAIEAISSKNSNPMAQGLAFQAIKMITSWLPLVVDDGNNIEGRSQLLFAAHMAGRAFATGTGLGLAHGIAHPLSARAGLVHGEALAVLLPHVMRFNLATCTDVYSELATSLGLGSNSASPIDNAQQVIDAVQELPGRLGLPTSLTPLGAKPEMVPSVAQKALEDEVTLNSPTFPSIADVEAILSAAL
jgi:alcohol dehydrogenase class IV